MASIGDQDYAVAAADLSAKLGISPALACTAKLLTAVGANKATAGTEVAVGSNPAYAAQTVTWAAIAADGNGDASTSNTAVIDWGALAGGPTIVGIEFWVSGARKAFKAITAQPITAGNHFTMGIGAIVMAEG